MKIPRFANESFANRGIFVYEERSRARDSSSSPKGCSEMSERMEEWSALSAELRIARPFARSAKGGAHILALNF